MARLTPKQDIKIEKVYTKDIDSKNDHLVIKANKPDDNFHVKVDDLLRVDKIEGLNNEYVEIPNLKVTKINDKEYGEESEDGDADNKEFYRLVVKDFLKINTLASVSDNDIKFTIFNKYGTSQIYICGDYFNPNSCICFGIYRNNNRNDTFSLKAKIDLINGNIYCTNIQTL